ncbi:MAG: phosphotransferase [Deltaproteobacteria bacterium]|jgi:homoserine kinase type II|nr:phosphotransferase [Deltaproteobacteria bacterium]
MDSSKMKPIAEMSPSLLEQYRDMLGKSQKLVAQAYEAVESQFLYNQLREIFENYYDLGTIKNIFEVFGGYTNRSFGVITVKDGRELEFFVRKYKAEVSNSDVLLEHGLISYALEKGFSEAAGIFKTIDGRSFIRLEEIKRGKKVSRVFSVYRFLNGLDKYTWIENKSTLKEFYNLGDLLARFHKATNGFEPDLTQKKTEPKVEILLPDLKRLFSERATQPLETMFNSYFISSLPLVLRYLEQNIISPEEYALLPVNPIHGDYHAGNVKFEGEETVGLFDFDWSKIDVRLFDVCLGLVYCCASWNTATDGQLRLDDCRQFLKGYNSALEKDSSLPPLTKAERKVFHQMIFNANIYLIYWLTELWYYLDPDNINDYEAISYMNHFIKALTWSEDNLSKIKALVDI